MLGFSRWQIFKALAVAGGIMSIISLALVYFFPAPPSKVTMATAFKGSSVGYYGRQYREIFARSNIELELRETAGQWRMSSFCKIQNPAFKLLLWSEASRTGNMHQDCYR